VLLLIGAVIRVFAEERLLMDRYPGYRNYCQGTKRMVPYSFSAFICLPAWSKTD